MRLRTTAAVWIAAALSCAVTGMTAQAEESDRHGWVTENGRRYYYDADGEAVTGEQQIDGVPYLFAPNGVQQTGWQTVDGRRFYYDRSGAAQFGWIRWRGGEYYIDPEAGKQTGRTVTGEGVYQLDAYGSLQTGWIHTEEGTWRYAGESAMLASGEVLIGGQPYLFDETGDLQTGWQTPSDGVRRFYDPDTARIGKGFIRDSQTGTVCYAADDYSLLTGLQTINGRLYCFDSSGVMQTGFVTVSGSTYYFDPKDGDAWRGVHTVDGAGYLFDSETCVMQTGLIERGSVRFCYAEDGKMLTDEWYRTETDSYYFGADGSGPVGMTELDGSTYAFDRGRMITGFLRYPSGVRLFGTDGKMAVGLTEFDGEQYLFSAEGIMQTGWQETDGGTRFFREDGSMATGVTGVDGVLYLFGGDGALQSGMAEYGGAWYLFGEDGTVLTGWQDTADGSRYFAETGKMATGRTVIGGETWILGDDGLRVTGAYTASDGKQYYCKTAGKPVTGWFTADGKTRHYGTTGAMTVSATVDGYVIDAAGNARTQNAVTADAIIKEAGKKPTDLFPSFVSRYRYSRIEQTRPYETLRQAGWEKLITYLFENRKGVCYYLAAAFDFVCQRAGMETRIVHTVHDTGDHYWVQVKAGSGWQNYDPTYKARNNIGWNEIIKLGNYKVLGYITVRYDDRGTLAGESYQKNN